MTATTDFIAELIRAANEVEKIGSFERKRLLERAVTTIRDMRDTIGIPSSKTEADVVIDFQTTAYSISRRTDDEVKAALLKAAGTIRDLRVVIDTNVDIILNGKGL